MKTELNIETLKKFKKDLKMIGYKTKLIHFSDFTCCKVVHIESKDIINYGNVFTKDFLDKHKAAFNLINEYKTMTVVGY